jgi:hypothetical protein
MSLGTPTFDLDGLIQRLAMSKQEFANVSGTALHTIDAMANGYVQVPEKLQQQWAAQFGLTLRELRGE